MEITFETIGYALGIAFVGYLAWITYQKKFKDKKSGPGGGKPGPGQEIK